jgi:hypothetical protein
MAGFNKPTRKSHLERVRLVADMLARGYRKLDIKLLVKKKFGVTARTVENYLSHARRMLMEELGTTRHEQRAKSLDFYKSILKDTSNANTKERLQAQQRIDKILGLEEPTMVNSKVEHTHEHDVELKITKYLEENPQQRDVVLDLARKLQLGKNRIETLSS